MDAADAIIPEHPNKDRNKVSGSVRTIPWTLGEPTFFFLITRGGGSCAYNDLQRYITATSVCTTCFMQALYRINHYTGFTLLYFIDTN